MAYYENKPWGWGKTCNAHNWKPDGDAERCLKCRCTRIKDDFSSIIYDTNGRAVHHRHLKKNK